MNMCCSYLDKETGGLLDLERMRGRRQNREWQTCPRSLVSVIQSVVLFPAPNIHRDHYLLLAMLFIFWPIVRKLLSIFFSDGRESVVDVSLLWRAFSRLLSANKL